MDNDASGDSEPVVNAAIHQRLRHAAARLGLLLPSPAKRTSGLALPWSDATGSLVGPAAAGALLAIYASVALLVRTDALLGGASSRRLFLIMHTISSPLACHSHCISSASLAGAAPAAAAAAGAHAEWAAARVRVSTTIRSIF